MWVDWTEPAERRPARVGDGAASLALECDGRIAAADVFRSEEYPSYGSPQAALNAYFADRPIVPTRGVRGAAPPTEYRIERTTKRRVLFSYDVAGRTRAAIIVADDHDPATWAGAWAAESTAACDAAEFPADGDGRRGVEIWLDRNGDRVDSRRVRSYKGLGHCHWQDVRFLKLDERDRVYVRDPGGAWAKWVTRPYAAHAELPASAKDSGFHRDGAELWLTEDPAYLVSEENVELWPRATDLKLCA